MYALWWLDPFRIRRLPAQPAPRLSRGADRRGHHLADEAWRGYYDDGYFSKFARSGAPQFPTRQLWLHGIRGRARRAAERLPLVDSCHVCRPRPHIINDP